MSRPRIGVAAATLICSLTIQMESHSSGSLTATGRGIA
jgi:hypothetical protein